MNKDFEGSKDVIKHVDSMFKMLSALTGDNSFEVAYNESNLKEKGGVTMCEVYERIINKGIAKGRAEGLTEGKADVIRKMLDAKALTVEQIADILKLPIEEVRQIAQKVPVMN